MWKVMGMACIMTGCIGFAAVRTKEERYRIFHLREMIRIIRRIQDEMGYGKRTVPEICALLMEIAASPYDNCFGEIYQQMDRQQGVEIGTLWKEKVEACLQNAGLSEDEKSILSRLPESLGIQDERLQAAGIGQSIDRLERSLQEAEVSYGNRSRMIYSVSTLVGIFIVILLL